MTVRIVRRGVIEAGGVTGPWICAECGERFDPDDDVWACPQCGQRALLDQLGAIDAEVELHNGTRLLVQATRDPQHGGWVPTVCTRLPAVPASPWRAR